MVVRLGALVVAAAVLVCCKGAAPEAPSGTTTRYEARVPESVLTPDAVETEQLGTLAFDDGMPSSETHQKVSDYIDTVRGVETFLNGMPAASLYQLLEGMKDAGMKPFDLGLFEELMDARSLYLTANSTTLYGFAEIDVKAGPVVLEVPPAVLGAVDDALFHWVTDVGLTGPDQGKGGKYLFLPPGYEEAPPAGYTVVQTKTYRHWLFIRGFVEDGNLRKTARSMKAKWRLYPLSEAAKPRKPSFVNLSGKKFNTIHANDFGFFEELNAVVQYEPTEAFDPELLGQFASIGIEKGKPFAPDANEKKLLTDAAAIANAAARAISYRPRSRSVYHYEDRQWYTSFSGGSHEFLDAGGLVLDDRVMFHYNATGITPAMSKSAVGQGSAYAFTPHDAKGEYLDGGKTYQVTLPAEVPAKQFWSFMVYSGQHRSMLETDQQLAGVDSNSKMLKANNDGSHTVWFGPEAPKGHEGNWVQTIPGKSYSVLLRLYGPLDAWFDKSWKPSDFELVDDVPAKAPAKGDKPPRYSANVPEALLTPDRVKTKLLGDLEFFDGMPSRETVQKVYDFLDVARGVETFLTGVPAASLQAGFTGLRKAGLKKGDLGIFGNLMDARGLFLTANSTTMYGMFEMDVKDGPVVIEVPPGVLGPIDDAYFRWVLDIGITGPDQGKGGKYLVVHEDYAGEIPKGYFVAKTRTYGNLCFFRAFVRDGDLKATADALKANFRTYPLAMADAPPEQHFVDLSGKQLSTIHSNTIAFYDELNEVVQHEPIAAFSPELLGLFASIGMKNGQPFTSDERMTKRLVEAAAIGNAAARVIAFAPRSPSTYLYDNRQWFSPFPGGSHEFERNGVRSLDDRTLFHYLATGITPAMAAPKPGSGSVYALSARDAEGAYLDGGKTYAVILPGPIPANQFWSLTVYSTQHRSMLETEQRLAGLDSNSQAVKPNSDGSTTIWFGPTAPEGHEGNWVQTLPGKSYFTILRLYGPLESWFDETWRPGDLELVK